MTIPAGMLNQRVTFRVPDPAVTPTKDELGNLVAPEGQSLTRLVRRWANIQSSLSSETETPGVILPAGSITVRVRRDSVTKVIEIGERLQWDNNWYKITDRSDNVAVYTVDFTAVPEITDV